MGTVLEIRLEGVPEARGRELLDRLFARAAELERVFSRFDEKSALSVLNRAAGRGAHSAPADLVRLLVEARAWSERTGGAFDATVGPLVELWTRAAERNRAPGEAELGAARARVGPGRMRLDAAQGTAALEAGSSIDLGAIAKGYALDVLVRMLREAKVDSALLSFGGSSLHAHGTPPGEGGWRVALRDPEGGAASVLTLRDRALSVSASLGQSSEIQGRHYGHVIDPRTGAPLQRKRVAAVLSPSGTDAEALSTALLVVDPDEGIALIELTKGAEAWIRDVADPTPHSSSGWQKTANPEPLDPAR
jgi:thiamine biosynthesis lipoprotein